MRIFLAVLELLLGCSSAVAAAKPPVYLWLEPEWFEGVHGSFAYWTGSATPPGGWGVAGRRSSAESTQGGDRGGAAAGAATEVTTAGGRRGVCNRRAGKSGTRLAWSS